MLPLVVSGNEVSSVVNTCQGWKTKQQNPTRQQSFLVWQARGGQESKDIGEVKGQCVRCWKGRFPGQNSHWSCQDLQFSCGNIGWGSKAPTYLLKTQTHVWCCMSLFGKEKHLQENKTKHNTPMCLFSTLQLDFFILVFCFTVLQAQDFHLFPSPFSLSLCPFQVLWLDS